MPRWEHGYRCHGYWVGDLRVGAVGLGPSRCPKEPLPYGWECTPSGRSASVAASGRELTLRAAKRQVERAYTKESQKSDQG
jgi:hypothetical protein